MRKGSELLNKGKENFFKRLSDSELVPIEIPEWGGTIYRPVSISVERISRIKAAMESNGLEHLVQIIIDIARDEDGKPLFRSTDKDSLMREQDPNVVIRVANELSEALVPEEEPLIEEAKESLGEASSEASTP